MVENSKQLRTKQTDVALDVEVPDPPSLRGPQNPGDYDAVDEPEEWTGDDYRREALAEFLRNGAWEAAFYDWAEDTYLTREEFQAILDWGLIDRLDFYWNPAEGDVGYLVPSVPKDLETDDTKGMEEELDTLGRTVSEVLENDYVHRGSEEFGYIWE